MSRLKPCANTRSGSVALPAARTASSVPSTERTGPRSSGGGSESRSWASGSLRRREFRTVRPTTPATAAPARPAVKIAVRLRLIPPAPRCSPNVLPRHALADRGHDLVADRAQMPRELLRGDAFGSLGAEQHDLVARRDLGVAAVHEQLVHRHGPSDPVPPATYEDLGAATERARITVPIPDRNGRDGRIPL